MDKVTNVFRLYGGWVVEIRKIGGGWMTHGTYADEAQAREVVAALDVHLRERAAKIPGVFGSY